MCYVIPIVHAMLLRQDMKKARLPTQASLWVKQTHYVLLADFM